MEDDGESTPASACDGARDRAEGNAVHLQARGRQPTSADRPGVGLCAPKRVMDCARDRIISPSPSPRTIASMKTAPFLFVAVAVTAALGCAAAATPAVVAVSSATVAVHQPQLEYADGAWRLSGCVAPRRGSQPAPATHLDVVCLDASGLPVASKVVPLKASTLRFRPRATAPHVRFTLADGLIAPRTARIEVRAHDQSHHQP